MKRIGIVAHSAEGGALCFITVCREGQKRLGPHNHPEVVVSAIPMGLSMPGWESDDLESVGRELRRGVEQVAAAGADFFVCPDNTAHLVLESIAETLPIPGIHIAHVVANEVRASGWTVAALLGTTWTVHGPVYPRALDRHGLELRRPDGRSQQALHRAIFDELCRGEFLPETTERYLNVIRTLQTAGAECVILGCTEIPLIINADNSPLPVLDSTRLLATYAVHHAMAEAPLVASGGWIEVDETPPRGTDSRRP